MMQQWADYLDQLSRCVKINWTFIPITDLRSRSCEGEVFNLFRHGS